MDRRRQERAPLPKARDTTIRSRASAIAGPLACQVKSITWRHCSALRTANVSKKRASKEISLSDYLSEKYAEQDSKKSKSNVHVNKTASDVPVEQKDSDV
jgi:hypothetical protein